MHDDGIEPGSLDHMVMEDVDGVSPNALTPPTFNDQEIVPVKQEQDEVEDDEIEEVTSSSDEEDDEEEEVEDAIDGEESVAFIEKVKRMCELEDQIKEMNASKKVLNDEKNTLCKEVIEFMSTKPVGKVNYGENEVLYLDQRESSGSLTRKKLLSAIKQYHEVGEVAVTKEQLDQLDRDTSENLADAEAMYQFIDKFVGKQTKVVLVREKKDKKKRARKPVAPLSVYAAIKK